MPIFNSLGPGSAEAGMQLFSNELFRLQAFLSASLSSEITREYLDQNALRPEIPTYALDSILIFYFHLPGGRSYKFASRWSALYQAIHQRLHEYSLGAVKTGDVVNRVHSLFTQAYLPSVKRLKETFLVGQ